MTCLPSHETSHVRSHHHAVSDCRLACGTADPNGLLRASASETVLAAALGRPQSSVSGSSSERWFLLIGSSPTTVGSFHGRAEVALNWPQPPGIDIVRLVKIGVVFPQTEIGPDVGAVRAYGQCAAELGYHHVLAYDHVVGADPAVHRGWKGPYDVQTQFHEPFVLFGFLAGITSLHLVTGILILPQRQTVLVAKQAAELDLLSGGRLRLGVGVGWNPVEYDALVHYADTATGWVLSMSNPGDIR
jgi:hypothetical protein